MDCTWEWHVSYSWHTAVKRSASNVRTEVEATERLKWMTIVICKISSEII